MRGHRDMPDPPALRRGAVRSGISAAVLSICVLLPGGFVASPGESYAGPRATPEHRVKAAFLYNFPKFVEWPREAFADEKAPIILAVFGEDPFGSILEQTVEGKTVNGRAFAIKRFGSLRDLGPCHILFIGRTEMDHVPEINARLGDSPTLTVGEAEGFARTGGIIELKKRENRIRLAINLDRARRARLKLSSKLLRLAEIVRDPQRGED